MSSAADSAFSKLRRLNNTQVGPGDGASPSPPTTPGSSEQTQRPATRIRGSLKYLSFGKASPSEEHNPFFATISSLPSSSPRTSPILRSANQSPSERPVCRPSKSYLKPERKSPKCNALDEGSLIQRSGSSLSQLISPPAPLEGDVAKKGHSFSGSLRKLNKRFRSRASVFGSPRREEVGSMSPVQVATT